MTWNEMKIKYPEDRSAMSEQRESQFVADCFDCYESEGFAKKFWSPFGDYNDRMGQKFKVIGRCSTEDSDLSSLPMWNIKFGDGTVIGAYPEEIIPSEMRHNGCSLSGIELGENKVKKFCKNMCMLLQKFCKGNWRKQYDH